MNENNGWNGVPLNPERDGCHLVQNGKGRLSCEQWKAGMWSISGEGGWTAAQVATLLHLRYLGPCLLPFEITDAERKEISENNWPDPSPEMLNGDPIFDAIWGAIKSWDINVPAIYSGYCGATGNHARAIRDAIGPVLTPAEVDARIAAAHKEWLAELNHDTDALMEAARDSALAECIAACDAIVYSYRVGLPEKHKDRPGGIPYSWKEMWENSAEIAEDIIADIRALSDTPPGTMSGQLAKQDLRAADCIKQWPECESGAYDPRCCRFPKSCSCESGELKGEGND
jgi:hypothetical protein